MAEELLDALLISAVVFGAGFIVWAISTAEVLA